VTVVGVLVAGCGGGTTGEVSPPPPSPDFVLGNSPSSASVSQGTISSAIQVSVQPLNGFSGDVQVTLNGIPAGLTTNPQSPFAVHNGGSATLLLGASATASTGTAAISVLAVSGSISHSQPDTASGSSVNMGGVAGDANSGPVRVAATSVQTVFVDCMGNFWRLMKMAKECLH
jgi:hypothetical protein